MEEKRNIKLSKVLFPSVAPKRSKNKYLNNKKQNKQIGTFFKMTFFFFLFLFWSMLDQTLVVAADVDAFLKAEACEDREPNKNVAADSANLERTLTRIKVWWLGYNWS